jgi:hypothetical protein
LTVSWGTQWLVRVPLCACDSLVSTLTLSSLATIDRKILGTAAGALHGVLPV